MGIINQLDFKVANLIAAGEVVDRPASAVKELLENAIDAGAKNITVELKRGGVSFIRVTDDGCGMSEEDLPLCIKRHATSKIKYAHDLNGIMTLGFRGEALAAIAAVSRLRIITKTRTSELGCILESTGGEQVTLTRGGAQSGTTIIIEELFANVPARRKFLKKDTSEGMACCAVVEKIALSHPEISMRLITDGQLRYMTDGKSDLYSTIYAVLGREFSRKLLRVESLMGGISIYGFIGQPDNVRANRNFQNFFINGRYVKSRTCMSALEQAYESFIPGEKFPCCVLNLTIHPALVDVNVHPTKLEVKFSDEKTVFDAVYCAVRNALENSVSRPQMRIEPSSVSYDDIKLKNAFVPIYDHAEKVLAQKPEQQLFFEEEGEAPLTPDLQAQPQPQPQTQPQPQGVSAVTDAGAGTDAAVPKADTETEANPKTEVKPEAEVKTQTKEPPRPAESTVPPAEEKQYPAVVHSEHPQRRNIDEKKIPYYKIIGEVFNSYVMVEMQDKMLMIDKHAAHERIIFETMKQNMKRAETAKQMLMLPIEIMLSPTEYGAVCDNEEEINAIGFEYSIERNNIMQITAIPIQLEEESAKEMIEVLCQQLALGFGNANVTKNSFMERALYQASCKAAIKAGRIEDEGHIKWICDNLLALPDIKFCPHGRPVAVELTKKEMERSFKRT